MEGVAFVGPIARTATKGATKGEHAKSWQVWVETCGDI